MKLVADKLETETARAWHRALVAVIVRHPDPTSEAELAVLDHPPRLQIAVLDSKDTTDPTNVRRLVISTVDLTYFPGEQLARQWLAAGWAGYLQHEALELVTIGDLTTRPLDPHEAPFRFDRGLRCGLPVSLTPETLVETLATCMPRAIALEVARCK